MLVPYHNSQIVIVAPLSGNATWRGMHFQWVGMSQTVAQVLHSLHNPQEAFHKTQQHGRDGSGQRDGVEKPGQMAMGCS